MSYLELKNISHQYSGETVVDNVNLNVDEGEVVCLVGPSGCGKSTILRLIAGLEELKQGKITINGKNANKIPVEKRQVGMVFQNPSLFPHINTIDNTAFGLINGPKKVTRSEGEKVATERLEAVGMEEMKTRFPHMLSGGQQQRVALARALSTKPKLMLLDEPFANLDTNLRKRIREETFILLKDLKVATLLVTHDPEEALRMADRIYVMENGHIEQSGSPTELYSKPKNAFVARFFGELNKLDVLVKNGKAETPFGVINVNKVACENVGKAICEPIDDNTPATAFIRPEALSISKRDSGALATVDNTRFLGFSSLIYVTLKETNEKFRIRITDKTLPKIGEKLYLILDESQVFIFKN